MQSVLKVWVPSNSTDILGNNLDVTYMSYLRNSEISTQLNGTTQEYTKCTSAHTCVHTHTQTHTHQMSNIYHYQQLTACTISHICPHLELQLSFGFQIIFCPPLCNNPHPQANFRTFSRSSSIFIIDSIFGFQAFNRCKTLLMFLLDSYLFKRCHGRSF